jgi:membrane protease YdiL (CAAX protease family)
MKFRFAFPSNDQISKVATKLCFMFIMIPALIAVFKITSKTDLSATLYVTVWATIVMALLSLIVGMVYNDREPRQKFRRERQSAMVD